MDELYRRTSWINKNIDFVFGLSIIEYDIKSAGPSLCKEFKLLPKEVLDELDLMEKKAKNIKIGLIQKHDKEFTKNLLDAFCEARRRFLIANDLEEDDIISIKKDAIFVLNKICTKTDFGEIHFVGKNRYTSYFRLNKLEFYLNTNLNKVDIKGLGQGDELQKIVSLHGDYILKFMLDVSRMKERNVDRDIAARYLSDFVHKYRKKELPADYYRELSRENVFRIYDSSLNDYLRISEVEVTNDVEIGYNYMNYIVPLVGLFI
jgi:hypothetical protein